MTEIYWKMAKFEVEHRRDQYQGMMRFERVIPGNRHPFEKIYLASKIETQTYTTVLESQDTLNYTKIEKITCLFQILRGMAYEDGIFIDTYGE